MGRAGVGAAFSRDGFRICVEGVGGRWSGFQPRLFRINGVSLPGSILGSSSCRTRSGIQEDFSFTLAGPLSAIAIQGKGRVWLEGVRLQRNINAAVFVDGDEQGEFLSLIFDNAIIWI
jgi:hypothetical protein